jgi:hypothetical protein
MMNPFGARLAADRGWGQQQQQTGRPVGPAHGGDSGWGQQRPNQSPLAQALMNRGGFRSHAAPSTNPATRAWNR